MSVAAALGGRGSGDKATRALRAVARTAGAKDDMEVIDALRIAGLRAEVELAADALAIGNVPTEALVDAAWLALRTGYAGRGLAPEVAMALRNVIEKALAGVPAGRVGLAAQLAVERAGLDPPQVELVRSAVEFAARGPASLRVLARDRKDPKSRLASPNHTETLSGLILGRIEADFSN